MKPHVALSKLSRLCILMYTLGTGERPINQGVTRGRGLFVAAGLVGSVIAVNVGDLDVYCLVRGDVFELSFFELVELEMVFMV